MNVNAFKINVNMGFTLRIANVIANTAKFLEYPLWAPVSSIFTTVVANYLDNSEFKLSISNKP